ncbi:MAG: sugar phosphate isomerase, partial [Methanosphaera sp. rholeuAM6]
MKISVSTLGLYPAKMENILEFVTGHNLDYLEIITEYPYKNVTCD